tara:strand:- start:35918 stop:36097 length:180 start_codon:yes stop_codon:yes gene_type:complete
MSYKKFLKRLGKGNPRKSTHQIKAKGEDLDINQRVKLYADTTTSGYYIDYLKRKSEEQK